MYVLAPGGPAPAQEGAATMAATTTGFTLNQDNPFSHSVYREVAPNRYRRVAVINSTSVGWEVRGLDGAYLGRADSLQEALDGVRRFAGEAEAEG
jgi:hypothetical protein